MGIQHISESQVVCIFQTMSFNWCITCWVRPYQRACQSWQDPELQSNHAWIYMNVTGKSNPKHKTSSTTSWPCGHRTAGSCKISQHNQLAASGWCWSIMAFKAFGHACTWCLCRGSFWPHESFTSPVRKSTIWRNLQLASAAVGLNLSHTNGGKPFVQSSNIYCLYYGSDKMNLQQTNENKQ